MAKSGKKAQMTGDLWKNYSCYELTEKEKLSDLYQVCKEGRIDVVKILEKKGKVDVNKLLEEEMLCQGLTVLHIVTRHNHIDCLKYLLSVGANVDAVDAFGFRPIHDAALYGYTECLTELLTYNALTTGVDQERLQHLTPLYYAAQQNHVDCVKLLIERADCSEHLLWDMSSKRGNVSLINLVNNEKSVANSDVENWLRNSAVTGHVSYLNRLKKNLTRQFGSVERLQSVITATQHGNVEYLKCLLEEGMDPNISTKDQVTALHYAARYGHEKCIELLVKYGGDMNGKTTSHWSPLHIAIRQGCLEGIEALIKCGCDINQTGGEENDTPVHMALKIPVAEDIMEAILEGRPSLAIKNDEGKLPTEIKSEISKLNELVLQYARN